MSVINLLCGVIYLILAVLLLLLMSRIVVDFIQLFARSWRPKGAALVFATTVYRVTDKPLGWLRKVIPPLNLGGIRLDLSFIVLFFVVNILQGIVLQIGLRNP